MNRIKKRTIMILVVVALFVLGVACYCFRFVVDGHKWVNFSANSNHFVDGVMVSGEIYDRNGVKLAYNQDGERRFNDDYETRNAVCHTVGDKYGNVGTSVLSNFGDKLMGYDIINGLFSPFKNAINKVEITLDTDLCNAAYEALGGRRGCVLVCNYKTGEILCMVSSPTFDPENPPDDDEIDSEEGIYINRALSAVYPPGSIFKLVTLAAAIDNIPDLFSRTFVCEGSCDYGKDTINCMSVHGEIDIYEALSGSCNCAFSLLAQELGADTLNEYATRFGLTDSHSVNGITTASGNFTKAQKGTADLSWSGIGQYQDLVNPEAYLRLMNAIAGGGVGTEPKIIKSTTDSLGLPSGIYGTARTNRMMSTGTAQKLTSMMRNNVSVEYGQWRFGDLEVCAKSGTAEVAEDEPHSWFVGFVNSSSAPYSFVVTVENAGLGSTVAGSVAAQVLTAIK